MHAAQPPARFGTFSAVKSSPPEARKDRRYAAVTQLLEVCDGNRLLHRKGIVNPSVMACAMTAPLTQGSLSLSGIRICADGGSVRRRRSGIAGKRTRNARPYGVDAACCARRKRSGSVGQRTDVGIGPYLSRIGMPQKTRSTRSALAARSQRSRPVRSRQARSS